VIKGDFTLNINNMSQRFGEKSFDAQFVRILWDLVKDQNYDWFQKTCDVFIGERPAHKPPLIVDFREAISKQKQNAFQSNLRRPKKILDEEHRAGVLERIEIIKQFNIDLPESTKKSCRIEEFKNEADLEKFAAFCLRTEISQAVAIEKRGEMFFSIHGAMVRAAKARKGMNG